MPSWWKNVVVAVLALAIAGCSSTEDTPYEEQPVDTLYNSAMEELLSQNYQRAANLFEEVERQHPYSIWAAKAQVMGAYSYFRRDDYDDAINAADRFIQLHPTSPDAPYAYYLKALAYYEQIVDVGRDQRTTERALNSLEDVVRRYPDTQYARDANLKLDLTRDHLAGKEMSVGRFYLKRGELAAAINRFKRVVELHQTTSHVPEALLRLAEAYKALGLQNEARRMAAILGYNYPGSPWYADAYELVEGVELADFPRPDERAFYERWLDPDSTIAQDVPILTPPKVPETQVAETPPASTPETSAAQDAPQTPGEARAVDRAPLGAPSDAAPSDATSAPEAVAQPEPEAKPEPEPEPEPKAEPRPKPTSAERAALAAEAESQRLASTEAAGEWRRAAEQAASPEGKRRAEANVKLAEASAGYWEARGAVARATTPEAELAAEKLLAERSVDYWQAAADAAEDDLEKQHATDALTQAQKVLDYWRENGRRPTWLERAVRSVI